MKYNTATRAQGTNAALMFLLLMLVTLGTALGQDQSSDPDGPMNKVKNASQIIRFASNVNHAAMAIPMNATINSPYAELKPAFAPHGDRLYFSRSFHPDNTFGEDDQEDIWYCEYDSLTNTWSKPMLMEGVLNNKGPNFIESISVTGDTIILGNQYLKKGKMRDGVSYSVKINGEWSTPRPIFIKNDYNLSKHANHFVSLKDGVIISAIERSETQGQRDLYISFWNGEYATEPVNMGSVINSELEEASPYLACDKKTLYFASKGHNGFGGYDIFVSKRLDDSWTNWSVPRNLGPAVN